MGRTCKKKSSKNLHSDWSSLDTSLACSPSMLISTGDPEDTDPVMDTLSCFTLKMELVFFSTRTGKDHL